VNGEGTAPRVDRGHDPAVKSGETRGGHPPGPDRQVHSEHLPTKTGGDLRIKDEKKMLAVIGEMLASAKRSLTFTAATSRTCTERSPSRAALSGPTVSSACASKMFSLSLCRIAARTRPGATLALATPCRGSSATTRSSATDFLARRNRKYAEALANIRALQADCVRTGYVHWLPTDRGHVRRMSEFAVRVYGLSRAPHQATQSTQTAF